MCLFRFNDFARLKAGLSLRLALLSNFKWARRPVYLLTPVLLRGRASARGASSSSCVCVSLVRIYAAESPLSFERAGSRKRARASGGKSWEVLDERMPVRAKWVRSGKQN